MNTITAVGYQWDAIRMPRYLGLAAAALLGDGIGTVIVEPGERRMYVLVPAGAAATWDYPETRALGRDSYLPLPPPACTRPPGPYWLTPPDWRWPLADPAKLLTALEAVASPTRDAPCP
ncbi:hypothetical protein [Streptomyces albireticuli]|uniref:Uncharacterized protein n=1 Tax=Streptomyces albireticuli TaxID=1940 RepID=A0A2A2D135_9ACTN|nr:hypothetical protein [Streptomyces albireticuli]MCD9196096.1 hypothetical protein [Streptomyces albireticuli]PAU46153.1 hypothetical protein CK936_25490 [Streptomyces albireticuli]